MIFDEHCKVTVEKILQEVVARDWHKKEHQIIYSCPGSSISKSAQASSKGQLKVTKAGSITVFAQEYTVPFGAYLLDEAFSHYD